MCKFLTIDDLSQQWRIPKQTVYMLAQQGMIPGAIKFGRHWRFHTEDVEDWIRKQINTGIKSKFRKRVGAPHSEVSISNKAVS